MAMGRWIEGGCQVGHLGAGWRVAQQVKRKRNPAAAIYIVGGTKWHSVSAFTVCPCQWGLNGVGLGLVIHRDPAAPVALWRCALRRVIRPWRDNTPSTLIGQIRRTGNGPHTLDCAIATSSSRPSCHRTRICRRFCSPRFRFGSALL